MKALFLIGAAALASAPLLTTGGSEAQEPSCCATQCETDQASLASVLVAAPEATFDPDSTGSILVRAKFDGEIPERKPDLVIDAAKSEGCEAVHELDRTDRTRLIDEKGRIANVVVMVEVDGQKPEVPEEPITLDQRGCRFDPHIAVVPVGARVRYLNSDEINHNVHTFSKKNSQMNRNIAGGSNEEQRLEKDETFEVKCDIHPWMQSYVIVTEATRYNVTAADGTARLEGLPPGDYKVEYWHETLGKGKSDSITVKAGGEVELALELGGEDDNKGGGRRRRR